MGRTSVEAKKIKISDRDAWWYSDHKLPPPIPEWMKRWKEMKRRGHSKRENNGVREMEEMKVDKKKLNCKGKMKKGSERNGEKATKYKKRD
jgi:hypothetical protein